MTFIHPALLAGLALAAVPVILHLIMRQQPKRVPFPAFRFLARKATSNRRKLRLKHWLLLALRISMVALMCLALARPRIFSERLNLMGDRPAAAVVVLDTSLSMGYVAAGKTRLDDAKARALELLDTLPPGSRFAILDPAEPGGEWLPSLSAARERIATRELRATAGPLADPMTTAYRLFAELQREQPEGEEAAARFLYAVTDRTPASWDVGRNKDLAAARDRVGGPPIHHLLIDVGIDKPADVAITEVRLRPAIVPANKKLSIPVVIQAVGPDVDTQVQLRIDGLPDVEAKPVQLTDGQPKEVVFERRNLKPGVYQAEVSLGTADALVADNTQFVTFEVRPAQPILIFADRAEDARFLEMWLKGNYVCEVKTTVDPATRSMTAADLTKYRAVCLLSVAEPGRVGLWDKLEGYVVQGGGVAVFPGGEELIRDDYNRDGPAQRLVQAKFRQFLAPGGDGVVFTEYRYQHPLIAPFREWSLNPEVRYDDNPPRTYRYWELAPATSAQVLLRYADEKRNPAIVEGGFDRAKVRGKVLTFTTPFDGRRDARDQPDNDYLEWWFYQAIVNKTVQYLAGEAEDAELTHIAGRPVAVTVPPGVAGATFTLSGPGIAPADSVIPRPARGAHIRLTQPQFSGHYTLSTPDRSWKSSFSLNAPAGEFLLQPRVPVETIAEVLGPDAVLAPGQVASLKDKLDQHFRQPLELFPWLMLLLLILFAVENLFANRFYRRQRATEEAGAGTLST